MKKALFILCFNIFCFGIAHLLQAVFAIDLPPAPAKVLRYAEIIIQRYDLNSDGILQREEWERMAGTPQIIDLDGDGQITRDELIWYLTHYGHNRTIHRTVAIDLSAPPRFDPANLRLFTPIWQRPNVEQFPQDETTHNLTEGDVETFINTHEEIVDDDVYQKLLEEGQIPSSRPYHTLPAHLQGVPAWFILRDSNGDGQISLREFSPALRPNEVILFRRFDRNNDGVISPDEARMGPTP